MEGLSRLQDELTIEDFDCLHFVDTQTLKEFRQNPARRSSEFDPERLTLCFEKSIMQLDELRQALEKDQEGLISKAQAEETACRDEVTKICSTLDDVRDKFDSLDSRITAVSHKVGHLGDQLESANGPRERLDEMEKLMRYLSDFTQESKSAFELSSRWPELQESARVVQKLHQICSEFPDSGDLLVTKQRVFDQYNKVDEFLFKEFESAFVGKNYQYCYQLIELLASFKSFDRCTELFVSDCIRNLPYIDSDIFRELRSLVGKTYDLAKLIFPSPEPAMSAYVHQLFSKRLKELVANKLKNIDANDKTAYLKALESVYTECVTACETLSDYQLGCDLNKLTNSLFLPYLSSYFQLERDNLIERCQLILDHYYEEQNHIRRKEVLQQQQGSSRVLQLFSGVSEEQGAGRVLLCGLSVANIVAEVSQSCRRCRSLSPPSDLFRNAKELADVFVRFIYDEHVSYGIRLAALGLPQASEPASRPSLNFLEAVREANMIFHLCESKFTEILLPALKSAPGGATPQLAKVVERRRTIGTNLEAFIQQGLERCLNAIVGHVRHIFNSEQKQIDFKPTVSANSPDSISGKPSHACSTVCAYITGYVKPKLACLDGKNLLMIREELSLRLYRCLVEHFFKFEFSLSGGFQAVCDLTDYMNCLRPLHPNNGIVDGHDLYDTLYKLVNLLVIQATNLYDICEEDPLRSLNRDVKQGFIMLRADHRSAEVRSALERI